MAWKILLGMIILAVAVVITLGTISSNPPSNVTLDVFSVPNVEGWPWFEDSYFNLRFQYPPEWKVEKTDVTNYYNESGLDLMGEDAAAAGPDRYKTWIIRVVPPYDDIQIINRGGVGVVHSSIIIEQPNRFHGNNSLYSDSIRPTDREYESVLDQYDENFHFNFTSHYTFENGISTTSISVGHSQDGVIAGVTAVKRKRHAEHL